MKVEEIKINIDIYLQLYNEDGTKADTQFIGKPEHILVKNNIIHLVYNSTEYCTYIKLDKFDNTYNFYYNDDIIKDMQHIDLRDNKFIIAYIEDWECQLAHYSNYNRLLNDLYNCIDLQKHIEFYKKYKDYKLCDILTNKIGYIAYPIKVTSYDVDKTIHNNKVKNLMNVYLKTDNKSYTFIKEYMEHNDFIYCNEIEIEIKDNIKIANDMLDNVQINKKMSLKKFLKYFTELVNKVNCGAFENNNTDNDNITIEEDSSIQKYDEYTL